MWKKLLIGAAGGIAGTLAMRAYWKGASKLHGKDPRRETRPIQSDIEPIEVLEARKRERESQPMGSGGSSQAGIEPGAEATAGGLRSVGTTPIPRGRSKTGKPSSGREKSTTYTRRRRAALPIIRPDARYRPDESATQALGRIVYEKLRGQEPTDATKNRLATAISWAYGMETGAAYGLARAGTGDSDIRAGLVMGALMWLVGDEVAVPALGLTAGPQRYPLKQHIHRLGAHLAYGATTAAVTQGLWALVSGEDREWETQISRLRSG